MSKVLLFLARALFVAMFLNSGVMHIAKAEMLSGYAGSKGAPMPEVTVPFSGGMILTGAFGILTGLFPRLGAAMLASFLIPTSYFMHNFWAIDDPQQKQQEMTHFMKNMSMLGGALLIASLDKATVKGAKK